MKFRGNWETHEVWLEDRPTPNAPPILLDPGPSRKIYDHSPNGFNWSYHGSGPAQLALAILFYVTKNARLSERYHQQFKTDVIAKLPAADFELQRLDVMCWIDRHIVELRVGSIMSKCLDRRRCVECGYECRPDAEYDCGAKEGQLVIIFYRGAIEMGAVSPEQVTSIKCPRCRGSMQPVEGEQTNG